MLTELVGKNVVIDTPYSLQYVGQLIRFNAEFIELQNADVHDAGSSKNTKEQYLIEAAKGIFHPNRKIVLVKQSAVISISKLEDIIVF